MEQYNTEDTIAAIATPYGKGAISIIRVSGKESIRILKEIFSKKDIENPGVYVGTIRDNEKIIDQVQIIVKRAPESYTGEDMVEIDCHGGIIVTREVLETVLKHGAREALPGEFTLRAFLNGKIDLLQAEAINDIINARTSVAKESALAQLYGKLSKKILSFIENLKQLVSEIEVSIEYPEEEIEFIDIKKIKKRLKNIINEIDYLLSTSTHGKALKYGIEIVITGKTNAGKSSLFNLLIRRDKAIVSEMPGTTRDVIEEWIEINGIPIKLIDTAGFKQVENIVEEISLEKTKEAIKTAHFIIALFDISRPLSEEDKELLKLLIPVKEKVIPVINKIDLKEELEITEIKRYFGELIRVSVKEERGIEEIEEEIRKRISGESREDIYITSLRVENSLKEARKYIKKAINSIEEVGTVEVVSELLRHSIDSLKSITGEYTTEDILNSIFSNFCVGK